MDISGINDVSLLKSMAYDEIVRKEQAQHNLDTLNARITQLAQMQPTLQNSSISDEQHDPLGPSGRAPSTLANENHEKKGQKTPEEIAAEVRAKGEK